MFDFEKLEVYQKAKSFNSSVYDYLLSNKDLDKVSRDQLRRASLSIMLNIAEGSSRFSKADRRHFFVVARGSVFECVALFDFLQTHQLLSGDQHTDFYSRAEELSKVIFAMIRNLSDKNT